MKIRNGFVSNSSSSSYLIVLPDNYKIDKDKLFELSKLNHYNIDDETIIELEKALRDGELYQFQNYELFSLARDFFKEFSVFGIDVGSDDGSLSFIKKSELMKRLNKIK